jgi:hypothetical protein
MKPGATPRTPTDKGAVENGVGVLKRDGFAPVPEVAAVS